MMRAAAFFSNQRNLALTLLAASIAALATAYIGQYFFNLQPCPLCVDQRKPYMAVIALAIVAAALSEKKPGTARGLLFICGLLFLTGACVAGFHTGVEQGWWKGLQSCGDTTMPTTGDVAQLREYLLHRPIVDCRVAGGRLFGISMASYNFAASLFLAIFTFAFVSRTRRA